jgi:hypothetical protein
MTIGIDAEDKCGGIASSGCDGLEFEASEGS